MSNAKARFAEKCSRSKVVARTTLRCADARSRYFRGVVNQDFEVHEDRVLGKGCSGSVVAARGRQTGREVAVKTYSKSGISMKKLANLKSEVNIYLGIQHPHIASLLAVYEDEATLSFVMELCQGRELHDRLGQKKSFSEEEAARAAMEMCTAIAHLHEMGIVHRDLKLENWLYASDAEDASLKLVDFGFSLQWDGKQPMNDCLGTTSYMAPEVFRGSYTEKCDLWSIGVIVYCLLFGRHPFRGATESDTISKIQTGHFSFPEESGQNLSDAAYDFLQKLLTADVQARMSAQECLQHPWLNSEQLPSLLISRAPHGAHEKEILGNATVVQARR
jgi:calcium-dependent protein kinase